MTLFLTKVRGSTVEENGYAVFPYEGYLINRG